MVLDRAWHLGIGVVLAWAALPLLIKLARRSRTALPTHYYRTLVAALCMATALIFVPLVRDWFGSVLRVGNSSTATGPSSVTFVVEIVRPLFSTAAQGWPSLPFAAIGGTWLLLLAAGITASIHGQLRLHRAYAQAASAPARVLAHAERIAAELGVRAPAIHVSDVPCAAFTYGAFAPVIVISTRCCEMPDDELDFVLRHELWHVARHDTRAMLWIDLAQRCFAGHPSLPALATEIRVAREARADEAAAGPHALEYARFLLTVAEHIHSVRAPSASMVSMADTALERRVEILINPNRSHSRRSMPWLALTGLTLGSLSLLTPISHGQPERAINRDLSLEQALLEAREGTSQGLPKDVIRATIRKYLPQLRACFEGLNQPLASASISMNFAIDRDGKSISGETVDQSDAAVSTESFSELAQCVDEVRRTMQFPAPDDGIVIVSYPMLFEASPCEED